MKTCPRCGTSNQDHFLVCQSCFSDLDVIGRLAPAAPGLAENELPHLLADAFESTTEGMLITDASANILLVNRAFTEITGYGQDEVQGRNPNLLRSGRHPKSFYDDMWSSLAEHGHWRGEVYNRRKDGELYLQELSISAVVNQVGEVTHYVGIFTDITLRKEREARLEYLATHDSLTGLTNRTLFIDRLNHALARAERNQRLAAVMFIDLDGFKSVNDTYGHELGDRMLRSVAKRLGSCVRQTDTLARFGGDEFAVLIEELSDLNGAMIVAENIVTALSRPFVLGTEEVSISGSIGISLYPIDGGTGEMLLRKADVAMYRAKTQGKNNYQFHSPWR